MVDLLWVLICMLHLTVYYYHAKYKFQSESTLYSLPKCQGAPSSKQMPYLKLNWQQRESNTLPLYRLPKILVLKHLLIPCIQWFILIYKVLISLVSKLKQKASVYIQKWLKLHKSITSLSFYSSASPCPLPVRSLTSVLKFSKISGHLLLKHSQDASVSSCVPKLQSGNCQVDEAVWACETDLKHKSIVGHDQHSHHRLGYVKSSNLTNIKKLQVIYF